MLINRAEPAYRQIALYFEREIFEGRLRPGDRLPSTQELASQFGINHETVQNGLRILADRGLIERRRKCGSFVKAAPTVGCIGFVYGRENYGNPDAIFFPLLMDRLATWLSREGWHIRFYAMAEDGAHDYSRHELERDISSGELAGLVNLSAGVEIGLWLRKHCLIPYFICPINPDYEDFITRGIGYLAKQGRRNPVLIFDEEHCSRKDFENALQTASAQAGIAAARAVHAVPTQNGGFDAAKRILDEGIPVDSLLILYDNTCRGVLYHLLLRQIEIPRQIAILTHSNKGINLMCHMPLTRLEFDPDDFARQAGMQILAQLAGRKEKSQAVKATLIPGKTCGET